MADLELDFWPPEKLNALVECLRAGIRTTDYKDQFELPSVEDLPFWQHAASQCDLPGALDGGGEDVALDLAECVHAEFGVRDLVKVSDQNVWLGDLSASESRLVMLQLGIKAIVTIASQEVDPLWKADGIEYHTVVINQCSGKGESLREQLESCCAFLSSRRPALVCCGSGNGPSVIVCSAVLAIDSGGVFSAQQALDLVASKRVHVEVSSADVRDLEKFCEGYNSCLVSPQLKPTPCLPPEAMAIAGSKRAVLEQGLHDQPGAHDRASSPPSSLDEPGPQDEIVSPPALPPNKRGKWATAA